MSAVYKLKFEFKILLTTDRYEYMYNENIKYM